MRATTIKVEGDLLDEIEKLKPSSQSLSAYVRSVLRREIQRHKMTAAAERYAELLRSNPAEREWLDEWETAELDKPAKKARR
jgi:hypothetical protein